MNYWIFKCNPKKYQLSERLADPNPDITWTVSRYRNDIGENDVIFVWETGKKGGIRAVLKAKTAPKDMAELKSEQSYWAAGDTEMKCRVLATITHRDMHLTPDKLRSVPGLENLCVFHGFQQATNFRVTPAEGAILERLVEK